MKPTVTLRLAFLAATATSVAIAQNSSFANSEKVANGLVIRYRDTAALCANDNLTLLPPRIQMSLAGMSGEKRSRFEEFVKIVHEEVGRAMKANPSAGDGPARARTLEVRLVDFRESNRPLNIATSLVGGAAIDPGQYRIELALLDPETATELAHADIDSTPTIRGLLLGNAFSRQSSIRRNIRGQLKKLESYWDKRQNACRGVDIP